jgi:hypothetical protein
MIAAVVLPWLVSASAMCGMAWLAIHAYSAPRSRAYALAALVAATLASLPAGVLPLSHASPFAPPDGTYQILGGRIDVDKAIYVLLDIDGTPRLFIRPFTTSEANGLQEALDAMTIGGNGKATFGSGDPGGVGYDGEAPVAGDDTKQPEQPVVAP